MQNRTQLTVQTRYSKNGRTYIRDDLAHPLTKRPLRSEAEIEADEIWNALVQLVRKLQQDRIARARQHRINYDLYKRKTAARASKRRSFRQS